MGLRDKDIVQAAHVLHQVGWFISITLKVGFHQLLTSRHTQMHTLKDTYTLSLVSYRLLRKGQLGGGENDALILHTALLCL